MSPGFIVAMNAAVLACAPECGWTFANLHPKSPHARWMAIVSTWS
jgi:hypothetical protein